MSTPTSSHTHAHGGDHAHSGGHAHAHPRPAEASGLLSSAARRLGMAMMLCVLLGLVIAWAMAPQA